MVRVIVVGGGLSGCAAALAARKAGAEVILLERTNMLAGAALRAGDTGANGCFVGEHELRFLGGGEIFDTLVSIKLHEKVVLEDAASHRYIYNTALIEPTIRRVLEKAGVKLLMESRVTDVVKEKDRIIAVKVGDSRIEEGEAFVDCTGTMGGIPICNKYGKGCVLCLARCTTYGNRVGIVEKAGGKAFHRRSPDGTPGQPISSVCLFKETLSPELKAKVEKEGTVEIPIPKKVITDAIFNTYFIKSTKNIILVDIGLVAKCYGLIYMELDKLRQVPGFANAQTENPRSGKWNSIRGIGVAERDISFRVNGLANLFCAGEKSGQASVNIAIITGYLAGHNATRNAFGKEPLMLPRSLALGDFMAFVAEKFQTEEGRQMAYHLGGGGYWIRMQKMGLYTDDLKVIKRRVEEAGLADVLAHRV